MTISTSDNFGNAKWFHKLGFFLTSYWILVCSNIQAVGKKQYYYEIKQLLIILHLLLCIFTNEFIRFFRRNFQTAFH